MNRKLRGDTRRRPPNKYTICCKDVLVRSTPLRYLSSLFISAFLLIGPVRSRRQKETRW